MYHKIRVAVVSLVTIAICILSSSGTLSYFTDTHLTTSTFVVGNASTKLAIYDNVTSTERHALNVSDYGPLVKNTEVPFFLQATNDGNIPIYHRFRIVIPSDLADAVTLNLPNMNGCIVETSIEHACTNDDYIITYESSLDGANAEYHIISQHILEVGDTTSKWGWPTEKITFGDLDLANINTTAYTCEQDNANHCTFGINTYSDSIQATGFTDARTAFANLAANN